MPLMLLKSAFVGALAAIVGLVVSIVGSVVLGLLSFQGVAATGAGGLGAVSVGVPGWGGLLVMLVCFGLGSRWMYQRLQRRVARAR